MALLNLRHADYKSHLFIIRHAHSEHVEKWEFTYYKWITNAFYLSFDMTIWNMLKSGNLLTTSGLQIHFICHST
ncbi:hypothetical protein [Aquirufa nivalisilvae]|uniref:hypothetical protein n=1 Tax=Aquirufa nivalisilvae TaxID=2516557 RepID=UPI001E2EE52B|nr:hypothetical protein [Aquirufa nivalisilvae]